VGWSKCSQIGAKEQRLGLYLGIAPAIKMRDFKGLNDQMAERKGFEPSNGIYSH
jgi:hypothetical protein